MGETPGDEQEAEGGAPMPAPMPAEKSICVHWKKGKEGVRYVALRGKDPVEALKEWQRLNPMFRFSLKDNIPVELEKGATHLIHVQYVPDSVDANLPRGREGADASSAQLGPQARSSSSVPISSSKWSSVRFKNTWGSTGNLYSQLSTADKKAVLKLFKERCMLSYPKDTTLKIENLFMTAVGHISGHAKVNTGQNGRLSRTQHPQGRTIDDALKDLHVNLGPVIRSFNEMVQAQQLKSLTGNVSELSSAVNRLEKTVKGMQNSFLAFQQRATMTADQARESSRDKKNCRTTAEFDHQPYRGKKDTPSTAEFEERQSDHKPHKRPRYDH